MQPSEPVESYVAAVALRDALQSLPLDDMRDDALVVIGHRVPQSIEDKVARYLVTLIETIRDNNLHE